MSKTDDECDLFKPDKNNLDEEWVNQPAMYLEYALKLADAKAEHDRAKANLEVVMAEEDLQIRRHPEDYGLEKITEKIVESTVLLQSKVSVASEKLIKTKHKVDILQAYVYALENRKKSLENLVQLRLAEYYAEPKLPKDSDLRDKYEEKERKRVFGTGKKIR